VATRYTVSGMVIAFGSKCQHEDAIRSQPTYVYCDGTPRARQLSYRLAIWIMSHLCRCNGYTGTYSATCLLQRWLERSCVRMATVRCKHRPFRRPLHDCGREQQGCRWEFRAVGLVRYSLSDKIFHSMNVVGIHDGFGFIARPLCDLIACLSVVHVLTKVSMHRTATLKVSKVGAVRYLQC
jgi:hypothetical protein